MMKSLLKSWGIVILCAELSCMVGGGVAPSGETPRIRWGSLRSPVLKGDSVTAYRDPAAIFHDGCFYLYFTLVKTDNEGVWMFTAMSKSLDLQTWSDPVILTPRDRNLNFSSPGSVVRHGQDWLMCLQTYPRPGGEKYGTDRSRLWLMRSWDLESWDSPKMLRVKGPDVPFERMGRMIDPYLFQDPKNPGMWWCFYKQNGVSWSWSTDLSDWTFGGSVPAGENVCIVPDGDEYVMLHSPANGIGLKRSRDLRTWWDLGFLQLGQDVWPWAGGRLTAGFLLDLRELPEIGKWLLFFHGSAYAENDPRGGFDNHASIGLAWSDDLVTWSWPEDR